MWKVACFQTACVENYWFCEVINQGEEIMNDQFGRIKNIETLGLFLDLPDNILLQPNNRG